MTARNEQYLLKGFMERDETVFIKSGENANVLLAVSL
jgi:hypothetical protein